MTEQQARDDYARWFVREHFLPREYHEWLTRTGKLRTLWNRASLYNKAVLYKVIDEGPEAGEIYDESNSYRWTYDYRIKPPMTQHRIELDDLDNPAHDTNIRVCEVRQGREYADQEKIWQWLLAEAEYNRVYYEALVRSYGVDVKAP